MNKFNYAKWSAIIAAFFFLIFSTLQLLAFAISQRAIQPSQSAILEFVVQNFKMLNLISVSFLLLANICIYFSFSKFFKQRNQKLTKYLSLILLLANVVWVLSVIGVWFPALASVWLSQKTARILFALATILFGASILVYKENRQHTLLALGPMCILQGLFSLLALVTIVQISELTLAINILQAAFFAHEQKK